MEKLIQKRTKQEIINFFKSKPARSVEEILKFFNKRNYINCESLLATMEKNGILLYQQEKGERLEDRKTYYSIFKILE